MGRNAKADTRPDKPEGSPLFPHATGRWAKKIKGKLHYFGPWDDYEAALDKYTREAPYLHAGRKPPVNPDGVTLRDLCNSFLTEKQRHVDAGELKPRTFHEYFRACERLIETFGAERQAGDLDAADFSTLRAKFAKGVGPVRLGGNIRLTRIIFKFGYDAGLLDKPPRYGQSFNMPPAHVVRKARHAAGPRVFSADEIRRLVDGAGVPLKAMVLLGINCGMGNQDVADMPISAVDLDAGILDYPRPKTGIERRATLWPETVQAIREALAERVEPFDKADNDVLFITRYRARWVRFSANNATTDAVALEFGKLRKRVKITRKGTGFYTLRRMFETIAGETGDQPAVDRIMGHTDASMATVYRQWDRSDRETERLRRVTDHVRGWLWPDKKEKG